MQFSERAAEGDDHPLNEARGFKDDPDRIRTSLLCLLVDGSGFFQSPDVGLLCRSTTAAVKPALAEHNETAGGPGHCSSDPNDQEETGVIQRLRCADSPCPLCVSISWTGQNGHSDWLLPDEALPLHGWRGHRLDQDLQAGFCHRAAAELPGRVSDVCFDTFYRK